MKKEMVKANIISDGLVQGVGYRYFVLNKAIELGLNGYVKNQIDGTVLTVVEGKKNKIQILFDELKIGPMYSRVKNCKIGWSSFTGEFSNFEVRRY